MKRLFRCLAALMCVALIVALCACGNTDGDEMETRDPNWTTLATTERAEIKNPEGVSAAEFVRSSEFGGNVELTTWLSESLERAIEYTLICSKQEDSSLWHCWLYAEGGLSSAKLEFSKDANEQDLFLIRYTQSDVATDADGNIASAEGVWYFTVTAESLPQFEVLKDGENMGILVTYADASVAR